VQGLPEDNQVSFLPGRQKSPRKIAHCVLETKEVDRQRVCN